MKMARSLNIIFLIAAIFIAAIAGNELKPKQLVSSQRASINLENIIPIKFADWSVDPDIIPLAADPETQFYLNKFYSQTLSRTYVNSQGQRLMLSIAYGGVQNDSLRVHRPEVCYAAGGFDVEDKGIVSIKIQNRLVTAKRLLARQTNRIEPITYWMTVGNRVAVSGFQQKLAQLRYGFTGMIADGLLFRMSSIGLNEGAEYKMQEIFVQDLIRAVDPANREMLIGSVGP